MRFQTNDSSVTVSSGQLVIKKVDGTTLNPLQGAKFALTPYDPNKNQFNGDASMSGTTNASGELVFHITDKAVLPHVLYRLQETDAPAGYIKDSTPRYVFFYERGETPETVYGECFGTGPVQDGETAVQAKKCDLWHNYRRNDPDRAEHLQSAHSHKDMAQRQQQPDSR